MLHTWSVRPAAEEIKESFLLQPVELNRLHKTIALSGEENVETITVRGLLVAVHTIRHSFHIVTEDTDKDIRGMFYDAISEEHTVELPKRYKAVLRKTTTIQYSADQPDVDYLLISLEPYE